MCFRIEENKETNCEKVYLSDTWRRWCEWIKANASSLIYKYKRYSLSKLEDRHCPSFFSGIFPQVETQLSRFFSFWSDHSRFSPKPMLLTTWFIISFNNFSNQKSATTLSRVCVPDTDRMVLDDDHGSLRNSNESTIERCLFVVVVIVQKRRITESHLSTRQKPLRNLRITTRREKNVGVTKRQQIGSKKLGW